jgi:hypothetical protein
MGRERKLQWREKVSEVEENCDFTKMSLFLRVKMKKTILVSYLGMSLCVIIIFLLK